MIIYNVTLNIEDSVHDEWLSWMKVTHIPEVMSTGLFLEYTMCKLLTRQHDETGTTYVIQYLVESEDNYDKYQKEHAPSLQAKTKALFDGKFVAFRTLMQKID